MLELAPAEVTVVTCVADPEACDAVGALPQLRLKVRLPAHTPPPFCLSFLALTARNPGESGGVKFTRADAGILIRWPACRW